MSKNSKKRIQGKTWAFIIYPGKSAPVDWQDQIRLLHTGFCYSPVHHPDPDNPEGDHVHVILQYPHNMGLSTIEDISRNTFNGTQPFLVFNVSAYCRYLTHMGEKWKDKEQFDPMDVTFGDFDYISAIMQTSGTPETVKEIASFLQDHQEINSYRELFIFALENDLPFWLEYINSHVYQINSLLRGN